MAPRSSGDVAHVIRLGLAAAALHSFLHEHDDGETSWTSDARQAIAFLSADAARRYAARRLGGAWHVAEVDRAGHRRLMILEEFDDEADAIDEGDAGLEATLARLAPESRLITREQGLVLAEQRRALRRATAEARRL